ncbi:MAG: cobalamin biosynthesis protein [Desulfovibrio sp.]|jgi:cobalt-precorrin 5A hydrolase|nr:cobalamin biosynthesis protein [Desulfovibrio sp.]
MNSATAKPVAVENASAADAPPLACYVLSRPGLAPARRLRALLAARPWKTPDGRSSRTLLYAPERFLQPGSDERPLQRLSDILSREYRHCAAHVFVGAIGIAVRVLAPLLRHKSLDPPAVVLSPDGHFAISLVSGHWGGGNALARHIAELIGATPVITTASDLADGKPLALDMLLRDAGLRILDWAKLPGFQARLLEGRGLSLWDPCRTVDDKLSPGLKRLDSCEDFPCPERGGEDIVAVHWRVLPPGPRLLRCAAPRLFVGLGCRKDVPREAVHEALEACFSAEGLEMSAIAALATVREKRDCPAIVRAAARLGLPVLDFSAEHLAARASPNPSGAAGRRFEQPPFSVCEAAALSAAGPDSRLIVAKRKFHGLLTLAVGLRVKAAV